MAIDSEVKRKSIAAINLYAIGPVVVPDSTIDQADRQVIGYSYSGITAAGAPTGGALRLVNNPPLTSLVNGALVK